MVTNFRTVGGGSDWSFAKEVGVDANNPTIRNMLRNFMWGKYRFNPGIARKH
jgi:hypothetical protein